MRSPNTSKTARAARRSRGPGRPVRPGDGGRAACRRRPATGTEPRPAAVGEYEILGEIGRGGMGVVYRARHLRLGRPIALKILLGGVSADRADRFALPDRGRRDRPVATSQHRPTLRGRRTRHGLRGDPPVFHP